MAQVVSEFYERKIGGVIMRFIQLLILIILMCAISGCSSISAKITAAANINPDINGQPSPVAISIFELRDASAFERADFFTLYSNATNGLGHALLYQKSLVVTPGQTLTVDIPYVQGAHFVGYIAAYRNVKHVVWRGKVALYPKTLSGQTIRVVLSNRGLVIKAGDHR
jgi:type VI secretion system protein VasD